MNRRVLIFASMLFLLLVTGGLTSFIAANGSGSVIPGVLTVTGRPEASVSQFGGNQALWLFGATLFILANLVGASLTFTFIGWFLNREVTRAKAEEAPNYETLQEALKLPGRRDQSEDDDAEPQLPAATQS